jgi:GT2 family glycosyltransferase
VLTLVTVCFNNPKELEKTLSSVSAQSVAPDDYIIVDSFDADSDPFTEES